MTDFRTEKLNSTLKTFGIRGEIESVSYGARISKYVVKIDPQQKIEPLIRLAANIGCAFGCPNSVRISGIEGVEHAVGIEIPNPTSRTIYLRESLKSKEFKESESPTSFVVGENVEGKPVVADVAKMPHLLIGGTVGAGKSVFLNGLVTSILYKATPEEVKFLMIDPKRIEMAQYRNVPHLLAPIITDCKAAMLALSWIADEMDFRYELCEVYGVRDFGRYNAKMKKEGLDPLPRIVVVIDELSELMMSSESRFNGNLQIRNELEMLIARIAQKSRAAGIHLIIATQRPSKQVATGLIKDNLPSRVAFTVADGVASRIILDELGAERLLGQGDMLFKPVGSRVERLQGAYIDDDEIEYLVDRISEGVKRNYNADLMAKLFPERVKVSA
ncbi:MAG: FtsK/SpoIIIE domain-containing protein [Oscillospiraceae bacterium]|nr:FtsK/SpoIIIE domain-containing protein [Oscillospiraceae bacterium]